MAAAIASTVLWAACTNTSNNAATGFGGMGGGSDAEADAPVAQRGYLWFAGAELNAFTKDQTVASNGDGPAVLVSPLSQYMAPGTFHDMAFDPAGNVWTLPITGDQILRLASKDLGGVTPAEANLIIGSSALKSPQSLAFDSAGNLWVVNYNGAGPSVATIVRFDGARTMPGGTVTLTPSVTIGPGSDASMIGRFTQGASITFDGAGDLWFAAASSVLRIDHLATLQGDVTAAPAAIISTGESYASIAIDASGALWITATKAGYFALRFANAGTLTGMVTTSPIARLTIPAGAALFAGGMGFDEDGSLWIAMNNQIVKFASPSALSGNVTQAPAIVLDLPSEVFPDLASRLAFWPTPPGLPIF